MKRPFLSDRFVLSMSMLAAAFLLFVCGVAALRYKLPPASIVDNAIATGEAWFLKYYVESGAPEGWSSDDVIGKASISISKPSALQGYTLIATYPSTIAYLVDMQGKVVHRWEMPFYSAWPHPEHIKHPVNEARIAFIKVEMYPNGDLLGVYSAIGDTPYGYGLVKMDKNSRVLWSYNAPTHHDIYTDKHNGNIYALTHEIIETPASGLEDLAYPLLTDYVVMLSPEGKELKRISLLDSLRDSPYKALLYQRPQILTLSWDALHTNSIMKLEPEMAKAFPMFKPGQILLSVRNLQALLVLDPDNGKIVWATTGVWKYQHSAKFLSNGSIGLVDNLGRVVGGKSYSQVLEINPANNAITWSYGGGPKQPFFTALNGRIQELNNGNLLITEMQNAHALEVTPSKEAVWDYRLPKQYLDASAAELWQYEHADRLIDQQSLDLIRQERLLTSLTTATRYTPDEASFLRQP